MSGDQRTVIRGSPSQYVKLNVGGSLHYTTIGTLTKHDSMLRAMFSGHMEVLTDSEGWILIDRCGKHFGTILNYLRDGSVPLPEQPREIAELLAEAKYYLITGLVGMCESALQRRLSPDVCICRVPLITSEKEGQLLISTSTKPLVKLLVNRHNNKYSYTAASDDNLLRNLEMFDRLSLRFSSRVAFVKDVIGNNEICCWSFYGHGRKVAEVCCTSIVYATDKKQTKVEFPEARIYEEVLNILLYENNTKGPDFDLMEQRCRLGHNPVRGCSSAAAGSTCVSDEEEELKPAASPASDCPSLATSVAGSAVAALGPVGPGPAPATATAPNPISTNASNIVSTGRRETTSSHLSRLRISTGGSGAKKDGGGGNSSNNNNNNNNNSSSNA